MVKDPLTNPELSLSKVLDNIGEKISRHFFRNIDIIYVGNFDFLNKREIQAVYENSCIFVTNDQRNVEDMADDIVHEVAHSLEELHGKDLYGDQELEREFLEKRKQLFSIIKSENYPADLHNFLNASYSETFDEYLYQIVGYPALSMMSANLFYSPYAATSLREYFANGFEAYFYYGSYNFVKNNCPTLYKKLKLLEETRDDTQY